MADCSCNSHGSFLIAKGLEEAVQRRGDPRQVDIMEEIRYLDKVGSVSALVEVEGTHWPCDELLNNQYRRFLNEVSIREGAGS
jgi:hypothetical protein